MGKSWDASGIAFNIEVWQEALRVIKPGGHLIAFSGSRTYHRMAVAIEDAGFQIRDQIMWVYGSGFPKSHNIAKAIDKAGSEGGWKNNAYGGGNSKCETCGKWIISGSPCQCPKEKVEYTTPEAQQWDGWGTALKPAHEPMVLARKPLEGTVANNVLTYGVGGLNIDGTRVATNDAFGGGAKGTSGFAAGYDADGWVAGSDKGRFPANFIHDGSDEVVGLFPDTKATGSGKVSGFRKGGASENAVGLAGKKNAADGFSDSGSAARFFYCAKASKRDRNEGLDGFEVRRSSGYGYDHGLGNAGEGMFKDRNPIKANHHPTVKPTTLMQYLVRLVTPPNGIVLDPFMGSGSTGKACAYEGFDFIGIDQSAEYVAIAQARIDFALAHKDEMLEL
jgi:site-specific DNA-methyltransferase (adenine-specific)